ncbi:MAG: glycosyltransferase family 4 protein [Acidobacteria bacterium]|nr:glycosyltransferase family 4 protein [Acidobacteriota bacterium]
MSERAVRSQGAEPLLVCVDGVGIRSGGGAVLLRQLLRWLPIVRPGWRFHVFLLPRQAREFEDPAATDAVSVEFVGSDSTASRLGWLTAGLPRKLSSLRADVLFSFANVGVAFCPIPKVVYCQQSLAIYSGTQQYLGKWMRLKMALLRRLILRGCNSSQAVIVQTESMRQELLRLDSGLADRIRVIPAGWSEAEGVSPIAPDGWETAAAGCAPRLVFVSQHFGYKNHETLLRALPKIAEAFPCVRLFLTIDSPQGRNGRAGSGDILGRLIVQLGIEQRVTFLGTIPHEQVQLVLSQADVQVFPSFAESFGLPLLEAMVVGCPLVAADLPYAREVAGESAVYFPVSDPELLADAVIRVLEDEGLRAELARQGPLRAGRFHYRYVCESIAGLLQEAAVKASPVPALPSR